MTLLSANQNAYIFRANDKVANNFHSLHKNILLRENQTTFLDFFFKQKKIKKFTRAQ